MLRVSRVFLVVAAIAAVTVRRRPLLLTGSCPGCSGTCGRRSSRRRRTTIHSRAATRAFSSARTSSRHSPVGRKSRASSNQGRGCSWPPTAPSAARSKIPYHGDDEDELRTCARDNVGVFEPVTATLDGRTIALTQLQTALLNFVLPPDNVFGLPPGTTGQSVGDGWVALTAPLTPGSHEILIFTNGNQLASTNTIKVQPAD